MHIKLLAELFLNESSGGQVTEKRMDDAGIPSIVKYDGRSDDRQKIKEVRISKELLCILILHPERDIKNMNNDSYVWLEWDHPFLQSQHLCVTIDCMRKHRH